MSASANIPSQPTPAPQVDEVFLTRKQLCARWNCSFMTIVRREAAGVLRPHRFNARVLRYRLSDIVAIENAAAPTSAA